MLARWGLVLVVVLVLARAHDLRADGATLPGGRGAVSLTVQSGLSEGQGAEPFSVAPDAWYGISDGEQVGVVTSVQALTGFWSGATGGLLGSGVCLSGGQERRSDAGCDGLFESAGAQVVMGGRMRGPVQVLPLFGAHLVENDPVAFRGQAGARVRWQMGDRVSVGGAPSVVVGEGRAWFVPVEVGVTVVPRLRVGVQSGYVHVSRDGYDPWSAIPVAVGAVLLATPTLVVSGAFSFDRVGGYAGPGPVDQRSAIVMVGTML